MMSRYLDLTTTDDDLLDTWKQLDVKGDGKIPSSVLIGLLNGGGEMTKEVEDMMKMADPDGDGYTTKEDFFRMFKGQ